MLHAQPYFSLLRYSTICPHLNFSSNSKKDRTLTHAFIKPPDEVVQETLKILKVGFDKPQSAECIPGLLRAAALPNNPQTAAWSGDIYHRVADWTARHGNPEQADKYFQLALKQFNPSETLGPARTYRDYAKLKLAVNQPEAAFSMFKTAEMLHEQDRQNGKGRRQARITHANHLAAHVLVDDNRSLAVQQLTDLALFTSHDFCLRDQHDLVSFVLPYSQGAAKRALNRRQLEINIDRRRPLGSALSIATVVIDIELQLAGHLFSSIK